MSLPSTLKNQQNWNTKIFPRKFFKNIEKTKEKKKYQRKEKSLSSTPVEKYTQVGERGGFRPWDYIWSNPPPNPRRNEWKLGPTRRLKTDSTELEIFFVWTIIEPRMSLLYVTPRPPTPTSSQTNMRVSNQVEKKTQGYDP